MKQGARQRLAG